MRLDHLADRLGVQTLVGKPHVLANQVALRRAEPTLRQAITAVQAGLDGSADRVDDEPLFVFSAAWRSGSTLLQRLIVSTERHFLWGEPYDLCDLIRRLADSLLPSPPDGPQPDTCTARSMCATTRRGSWRIAGSRISTRR
jgi:hypothetical protein